MEPASEPAGACWRPPSDLPSETAASIAQTELGVEGLQRRWTLRYIALGPVLRELLLATMKARGRRGGGLRYAGAVCFT